MVPDVATLVTVLPVCGGEKEVSLRKLIHYLAVKLGFFRDLKVQNALMDMYVKCGYMLEAKALVDKNNNKNVVSLNSVIWACSKEGEVEKTFDILYKIQSGSDGVKPDQVAIMFG
ncbi:pentatricopeptide repeat-containing protein [Tanacetum coccineum]